MAPLFEHARIHADPVIPHPNPKLLCLINDFDFDPSRARFALASTRDLHGSWDAVADLGAAYPFGRYAARAALGLSAVGTSRVAVGPEATLSLATFF